MSLNGFKVSALVLGLFTAGCGQGDDPPASLPPPAESLAQPSGLSPEDEIDGLDLAVGSDGALHIVWREQIGLYGEPGGERIVYRRAEGHPLRWSRALVVAEETSGQPQVTVSGEGVHVVAGPGLRHWLLPRGSDVFADLGNMLSDEVSSATHDAITIGDRVVVVFVEHRHNRQPGVYALSWNASGTTVPTLIASGPGSNSAIRTRPELYRTRDRLMLAWAEPGSTTGYVDPAGTTVHRPPARVRVVWSDDAGLSWGSPREVMRTRADAVAAAGTGHAPLLFISAHGLYGSRWVDGTWTDPVRIAAYTPASPSGSPVTTSVSAVRCGGHTTVFWVDARHRRSDRRWWNPLGGVPWSDNPDWFNNDLFMAEGVDLGGDTAAIDPVRLTSGSSLTTEFAVAHLNDELVVFRVGRTNVRKSPDDAGAPPVILQSSVACR